MGSQKEEGRRQLAQLPSAFWLLFVLHFIQRLESLKEDPANEHGLSTADRSCGGFAVGLAGAVGPGVSHSSA
jgi:hypothetical protein